MFGKSWKGIFGLVSGLVLLIVLVFWGKMVYDQQIQARAVEAFLETERVAHEQQGLSVQQEIIEEGQRRYLRQDLLNQDGLLLDWSKELQTGRLEELKEAPAEAGVDLWAFSYSSQETALVDVRQVDLLEKGYRFDGKAHQFELKEQGLLGSAYINAEGDRVTMDQVIKDREAFLHLVLNRLREMGKTEEELAGYQVYLEQAFSNLPFTATASGLDLEFSPGERLSLTYPELFDIMEMSFLKDEARVHYEAYLAEKEAARLAEEERLAAEAAARARGPKPVAVGKVIALTFDDGPRPETTPQVLDLLAHHQIKATFFLLGQSILGNESIVQRMAAEGHQLANHTWSHPYMTKISPDQIRAEVAQTQELIFQVSGQLPTVLRPPYGSFNATVEQHAGLPIVTWTIDTLDWQSRDAASILAQVKAQATSGGVILMHDIHQSTVDALPAVIDFLKAEGYQFVTINELYGY
ncbi:peptidoglycan/xylan/chitin deacetylase (PgdA/CDA1 family) [Streptococcus rupicaprae]|uniref:Peptidoglycan/xylan/chitin deacetylase (PgdA/CDA1 family) n=1 Tax=Streptococcus rupicaprae TaxID=759619 RepID=A0ABV2FI73_9STRE